MDQHPSALVFLTSAYQDAEPISAFRRAAAADKYGHHRLTDDPAAADLIFFVENSHYHDDPFFKKLKNHPLVRQYPHKVFMYNPHDLPWLVLPGLYPCMEARLFDPSCMAASPYVERVNEYIRCDFERVPPRLYSFYGNLRMPVRRELRHLQHPRGEVREWTFSLYRDDKPRDPQVAYAELLSDSKFVLCPRGIGRSSLRLFETLEAGRVPVIISDGWVRPRGPAWDELAVFVPENQIDQIPRLLDAAEAQWPIMARRARAAWEEFFAPDTIFNYFINQLLTLRESEQKMKFPLPLYHNVQLARNFVRFGLLRPIRAWVQASRQKLAPTKEPHRQ